MAYTNNYCTNPAFQLGITGYSALQDGVINLDTSNIIYGPASLLVTCTGDTAGSGVSTASGTIPASAVSSASCYLTGTGNVTVFAVLNPGGLVVASVPVTLTNSWQRFVLSGIQVSANQSLNLQVVTTVPAPAQFWVSGVQIEDSSPAHPYCDGDQIGCTWVNSNYGGISQQLYQNPIAASSSSRTSSILADVLIVGQSSVAVPLLSLSKNYDPLVVTGAPGPAGAVTDFSVSLLTDPDPAQTYVSWNNAGTPVTSAANSWTKVFSVFIPPQDYLVSNGVYLYNRAAYAAIGFRYSNMTQNNYFQMTRAQAEVLPLTTGFSAAAPSASSFPRAINSIVVADRINACKNPSFEVSTVNWTPTGSATIAQDGTKNIGEIAIYDDSIVTAGSFSCNVTINASGDGLQSTIFNLIPGYMYTASAYVQAGPGLSNIIMTIGSVSASVIQTGGTGYGTGTYNAGPYGGINPGADITTGVWYRIWTTFQAGSDSVTLEIISSSGSDVTYPAHMWTDGILVEQGEVLGGYFDGSSGVNYSWDSVVGTPGLTRSYYYDQMAVKQQAVLNVLNKHTPLGISYTSPVYSVQPIQ